MEANVAVEYLLVTEVTDSEICGTLSETRTNLSSMSFTRQLPSESPSQTPRPHLSSAAVVDWMVLVDGDWG